jgi:glutamate carboxypeptidase
VSIAPTPDESRLLDRIADREADMLARTIAWAKINSGSANRDGLERMAAAIAQSFSEGFADQGGLGGAVVEEIALPPGETVAADGSVQPVEYAPAVRVRMRPEAPIQVALTGHSDTVHPADGPFQDVRRLGEGRIEGPGVADMKGGLVVMLEALAVLERSEHKDRLGWEALISPDEEIGSPGSRAALAELGARAHVGMTYEPALSDGALAGARKGSGNYAVILRGRSAHAGREHHLGRNAIAAAARLAAGLDALNGARAGVTVNVAKIDGGGPVNVVPDLGICRFNVRMPDEDSRAWVEAEIARLVAAARAEPDIAVELKGGITRPPKPMAPANARVFELARAAGAALGLELSWRDTGGVCEGNNLWGAGCPNVDTLGVRGGGVHSSEEWLTIASLVERARLSALMLMAMARGAVDVRGFRGLS